MKNNFWKPFRSFDWIFIVDIDEFLYHKNMREFLAGIKEKGYTVPVPTGYQMVSEKFPTTSGQIYDEIKTGLLADDPINHYLFTSCNFNKKCIINPREIIETNYSVGSHEAEMTGNIKELYDPELKLLHYRALNFDYLIERNKMRRLRQSETNRKNGFGQHYSFPKKQLQEYFKLLLAAATDVVS
jgi:hypothetical protein